jgi:hypothetical protein
MPSTIAGCNYHNCFYVDEHCRNYIHKYRLDNPSQPIKWIVPNGIFSLSHASESHQVIASFVDFGKIYVYTSDGELMKAINLGTMNLSTPQHCVEISAGTYIVCCEDEMKKELVCLLNQEGCIKRFDKISSNAKSNPAYRYLSLHKSGRIFLVDRSNNSIIVLNPQLQGVGEISASSVSLTDLHTVHTSRCDEDGLLYIGAGRFIYEFEPNWPGMKFLNKKQLYSKLYDLHN